MIKSINKDIQLLFFIILCIIILYFLSDVLLPFFIGIFVAYLLDPLVDRLEKLKLGRGISSFIILSIFFCFIIALLLIIVPILLSQSREFFENFPSVVIKLQEWKKNIITYSSENIINIPKSDIVNSLSSNVTSTLNVFLNNILKSSLELLNILGILVITPIVSWYILKDWDNLCVFIKKKIPSKHIKKADNIITDIDKILSSYFRGQLLVIIFLSLYYCIFFSILGLNYSILVGFFTGFLAFVPIIGIVFSFIIVSLLAFLQFVDYMSIIYVALIFIIAQILESYLLTPALIGNKLGLHPLVIILSIFCFGFLFGIIGIIFAIPMLSIISIFLTKWIKYLNNE